MCACKQGECFGNCPCGCSHTPPSGVRYYRDRHGFVGGPNPEVHDASARLVLVIDPEAPDFTSTTECMRIALRSLLPTPKPDEPQGLGAVVEDDEETVYVKVAYERQCWRVVDIGTRFAYADIAAVKVLSEGVTS